MNNDTNAAHLVILDDDPAMLKLVHKQVEKQFGGDFRYTLTSSIDEVLALAESGEINVCLTDLDMPGKDGFFVIQRLKRSDPLIQIVVMTGVVTWDAMDTAFSLGVNDYILKPLAFDELNEILRSSLVRFRRQKRDFTRLA